MNPVAVLFLAALTMMAIGAASLTLQFEDPLEACQKTQSLEVCQHEIHGS